MFMSEIFERIKSLVNSFINMEDKKKQREMIMFFVYFTIIIVSVVSEYDFSTKTVRMFKPLGNDFDDFIHVIMTGNFLYSLYILDFIKYNLIFLFIDCINVFFNDLVTFNIDKSLLELRFFFKKSGAESIQEFMTHKNVETIFNLELFRYNYFNYGFFKTIFFKSNLPIFFYFGLLFILTTISSLFLLSYYGFYGVFILNLISILLF